MTVEQQSTNSRRMDGLSPRERQVYNLIISLRSERPRGTEIKQQELADAIGVNKAVVSRALAILRARGIVTRNEAGASTKVIKRLRRKSA
jgi:predicted transcriptional regulator